MSESELHDVVLDAIVGVAPDVDIDDIDLEVDIREAADLDSMDFLGVVTALAATTGVEIPESDYSRARSVVEIARYLATRLPTG